jgi:hypothetical protein
MGHHALPRPTTKPRRSVKFIVKSRQAFCQVLSSYSLVLSSFSKHLFGSFGGYQGLTGPKLAFLTRFQIFRFWPGESSPEGCVSAKLSATGKARTPELQGGGKPKISIARRTVFRNVFAAKIFAKTPRPLSGPLARRGAKKRQAVALAARRESQTAGAKEAAPDS